MSTSEIQAAFRDASWFRNPDVTTPKKAHVLKADGSPACGLRALMCEPECANLIPDSLRCTRPGCKNRWPAPAK